MNEYIISILEKVPKDILIHCAEQLIFKTELKTELKTGLDLELEQLTKSLNNPDTDIDSVMERIKEIKKLQSGPSCITRSKVPLRDYQIKAIRYINDPKNNSLLIVHGTGTGKTLTALTASQCFLDSNPKGKVLVISPASLLKNFEKEMPKYGGTISSKYTFYSFTKFSSLNHGAYITPFDLFHREEMDNFQNKYPDKDSDEIRSIMFRYFNEKIKKGKVKKGAMATIEENPKYTKLKLEAAEINLAGSYDCTDSMVIIDEAHHLRSMKIHYKAIFDSVIKAKKLLLLTATPFVNKLHDFVPLINLLYRDGKILNKMNVRIPENLDEGEPEYFKVLEKISQMLNGRMTYHDEKSEEFFPTVRMHKIENTMNIDFFKRYEAELKEGRFGDIPELYYQGFRRAVNAVGIEEYLNQKMDDVLKIIRNGHQTLVFTNWLENGVEILEKIFEENDISYLVISGEVLPNERLDIVEKFNNKRVQTLIITIAGSEGLDLRETRNVIILDPVWNKATIDQIIGRAVRFRSHIKLPPNERYVDVYTMVLKSPYTSSPSGDELLYAIIERKTEVLNDVVEMMKETSI
jgi:superfamily II DNA or RNA helicase